MITLVVFLVAQSALHSLQPDLIQNQPDFIQNKLRAFAAYKSLVQEVSPEQHMTIKKQRNKYAHDHRLPLNYQIGKDSTESEISLTISYRQSKINELRDQLFRKELNSLLSPTLEKKLCKLIANYAFSYVTPMGTYKVCDKPIVGMYPINDSHIIVLASKVEDKELSVVLLDTKHNNITVQSSDEWDRWKKTLIKELEALPYYKQNFVDFDQSDEANKSVAINDQIVMWDRDTSYEKALAQGLATKIGGTNGVQVDDRAYYLTTSVKFSACGYSVIIGEIDGLIEIIDIATGDKGYDIIYNKNIMSLGVGLNDSLLIGFEDGSIDVLHYQCTRLPLTETPDSLLLQMPLPMTMEDYEPTYQPRDIADALCILDCLDCFIHTKSLGKTCLQCCCTGISCLRSCPRACWACSALLCLS